MNHPGKGRNPLTTASLDRVDPSKGYIPDNIRFVSMWVNHARHDHNDKELIRWCRLIAEFWKDLSNEELENGHNVVFPWDLMNLI